jgi:hypothetical protein
LIELLHVGEFGVDGGALGRGEQVDGATRDRRAANRLGLADRSALIGVVVQISRVNGDAHRLQRLSLGRRVAVVRHQLTTRFGALHGAFVTAPMQNAAFAVATLHFVA